MGPTDKPQQLRFGEWQMTDNFTVKLTTVTNLIFVQSATFSTGAPNSQIKTVLAKIFAGQC